MTAPADDRDKAERRRAFTPVPDEVWDDRRVEDATAYTRLVWGALWSVVSHRGRLPGTPRGLAARLRLTGSVAQVSKALHELERRGCIERYVGVGKRGAAVPVYEIVDYAACQGLPDNRRFAKKLPDVADPYPPRPGVLEPGWMPEDLWPAGRAPSEAKSQEEGGESEAPAPAEARPKRGHLAVVSQTKREEDQRAEGYQLAGLADSGGREREARARAGGDQGTIAAKAVGIIGDDRQLSLAGVTPGIRERAERWLVELGRRRTRIAAEGVRLPELELADVLLVGLEVGEELFAAAVGIHIDEETDRWWHRPLQGLRNRVTFARQQLNDERIAAEAEAKRLAEARASSVVEVPAEAPPPASAPTPRAEPRPPPTEEARALWDDLLVNLRRRLEPYDYKHWIAPMAIYECDIGGARLVLQVPDDSHGRWVEEYYGATLREALAEDLGGLGGWTIAYEP